MILSHKHRFVFIKGQKVAGTSVEIALSQICGPDDIITPITPADERLRLGTNGSARNYSTDRDDERRFLDALETAGPATLRHIAPQPGFFRNHMSLSKLLRKNPEAGTYRLLFTERSPYEKVVSSVNWRQNAQVYGRGQPLAASTDNLQVELQKAIDNGELLKAYNINKYKDKAGEIHSAGWRFETLNAQLEAFFRELGEEPIPLPQTKTGLRLTAEKAASLMTTAQLRCVNDLFADEFPTFGYDKIEPDPAA